MTSTRRSRPSDTRATSSSRRETSTTAKTQYAAISPSPDARFPDQRNELVALHHADDAVIVEFDVLGTHLGRLRALPPTGRAFRCRMSAHFVFEGDQLACERVYFDRLTIMQQLGLAHDSTSLAGRVTTLVSHPLTVGRALARRARAGRK
jgi:predicted ester cyclase